MDFSYFLAHQKGFGPPTFRLGGGCSIQLSYWCVFDYRAIVTENSECVNKIREIFSQQGHILSRRPFQRR